MGQTVGILKRSDLVELLGDQGGLCLSLFMPAEPGSGKKNLILFRDLVRDAERKLGEAGLGKPDVEGFLGQVKPMLADQLYWSRQGLGFALYLSKKAFRAFSLPYPFQAQAIVSKRFAIKPLIPLYAASGRFYVLEVSQNRLRLMQGTRLGMSEVKVKGAPKDIQDILKYEELGSITSFHTRTARAAAGGGRRDAMFYGMGAGEEDFKDRIVEYLRKVDGAVCDFLGDGQAPLIFAGVDYLFSTYKGLTHYKDLADEAIPGNQDYANDKDLHARAWDVAERIFMKARDEELARFHDYAGTGHASAELKSVIKNAYQKMVLSLFIAPGEELRGAYDPMTDELTQGEGAAEDGDDLIDYAAAHTIINHGNVYPVEKEKLPGGSPVAAIFRF